jgi:hypothetical protein
MANAVEQYIRAAHERDPDRRAALTLELFDAGELDADGRIRLFLTFSGPLTDGQ